MTKKQILTLVKLDYLNKSIKNFEEKFLFPCRKIDVIGNIYRYAVEYSKEKKPIIINLTLQQNIITDIF